MPSIYHENNHLQFLKETKGRFGRRGWYRNPEQWQDGQRGANGTCKQAVWPSKGCWGSGKPPTLQGGGRATPGDQPGLGGLAALPLLGVPEPPCRLSKKLHVMQQRCCRVGEMRQQETKRERSCDLESPTLSRVRTLTSSRAHSYMLTCSVTHTCTFTHAHTYLHAYTLTMYTHLHIHSHSFTHAHSVTHCHTLTLRSAGGTCLARPPRSSPVPSFQCHTWQVFRCLDPEQVLGPPLHCHLHLNRMAQEPQAH